jgi:subtilisin family serine protease
MQMYRKNDAQWLSGLADAAGHSAGRGRGILVGHIDSGVDPQHPALKDAVQDYRFFDRRGIYDRSVGAHDATGHGTVMAGLLAGRAAGHWAGGLAQEAQLLAATVIESGHHVARILSALIWMLAEPVRIVNLSIGIPGWNPVFRPVIQALRRKGVLVIAAIGNGGAGQFHSPGAYPEVLSVGAADETGKAFPFSGSKNEYTHCHKPDILALSTIPSICRGEGIYAENSGTSGATAFVSGVAAQLMSQVPGATACQVAYSLKTTALPLAPGQKHRSRAGLIQPLAAGNLLKTLSAVPNIDSGENYKIELFRDDYLQFHMKYLPSEHFVTAILYVQSKDSISNFIEKTIVQHNAVSFLYIHEKQEYAFVTAMKKQWDAWWEMEEVVMISRAS